MTNADTRTLKEVLPQVMEGLPRPSKETPPSSEPMRQCEITNSSGQRIKSEPILPDGNQNLDFRNRLYGLTYHHPDVNKLAEYGEWFFRRAAHNNRTEGTHLVLSGKTGCGKSHVAHRTFDQIQVWGVDMSLTAGWAGHFPFSTFVDWSELAEADDNDQFEDALYEVNKSDIIILDDVGAESDRFKNGINSSRLRRMLSKCEHKWLLVTTNLTKPQFDLTYDVRVADRLTSAHWVDLQRIPSYRPKLKHTESQ